MIKNKKIKYKDYLYKWLLDKKDYVKESTYANYSNIIFNYIIPKLGSYYLQSLNNDIIQDYILDLFNKENKSIKTIKDIILIIKSSLKKAFMQYKIKNFELNFYYPKDQTIKSIHVLSKNEQNKITKYVLNNINNKNIGILISLLLGIRIGELCALKWSDIDFKSGMLTVNKTLQRIYTKDIKSNLSKIIITTPKSYHSNRIIPINKEFLKILCQLKNNDENYILTGTYKYTEPRVYRNYFNNFLKRLDINHINFHTLRHTFATNCVALGIDYKTVGELLGHSNINITFNLYVHPSLSEKEKCINILYNNYVK